MDFSLLVSILAVVVSLWATWRVAENSREANRLSEENNKLNERLVVLEEERREEEKRTAMKANMTLYKSGIYLVAENKGPGVATDVHLWSTLAATGKERVEELHPGNSVRILLGEGKNAATMKAKIHLTWKHPSGESDELTVLGENF